VEPAEKAVDLHTEWSAPPRRDPVTGKFIKGTGGSLKGGRPKGSKDRVSKAMVDLATDLVANRGSELFEAMADRDPAQALALVAKIVPPEEMRAVFQEEREPDRGQAIQVNIGVVPSPQRLPDSRSQQLVDDNQRGLTTRLSASQEDRQLTVGDSPSEHVSPSGDRMDAGSQELLEEEQRLMAELERVRKQNEAIKAHGGLVGRAPRSAAPDTLEYKDDEDWV
jgi:hypothetical protein